MFTVQCAVRISRVAVVASHIMNMFLISNVDNLGISFGKCHFYYTYLFVPGALICFVLCSVCGKLLWFSMWLTLHPFLFLYSWVFSAGGSVGSDLFTLVPSSRILLPWRWRRYVPPKSRFTQDLHGATSQKTKFLKVTFTRMSRKSQVILFLLVGRD
jgi:hypothetical protein